MLRFCRAPASQKRGGLRALLARLLFLAATLSLLRASAPAASSASNSVTASVLVSNECPYSLSLTPANTEYILPIKSNVVFSYATDALGPCAVGITGGTFSLYNTTNTVFTSNNGFSDSGTIEVSNSVFDNVTSTYTGELVLFENSISNDISTTIHVVKPANITITGFSALPSPVNIGSAITLSQTLVNTGFLAPSNMILHTRIDGPSFSATVGTDAGNTLSTISFQLGSVTPYAGTYTVYDNVSYYDGSSNRVSKNFTTTYSVTSPSGGGGGGAYGGVTTGSTTPTTTPPPTTIGAALLSIAPLFTDIFLSKTALTSVGFTNAGSYPVWVNATVAAQSFGSIALSSNAVYLLPNSSVVIQAAIHVNPGATAGSYVVPINLTVSAQGHASARRTLFLSVYIQGDVSSPTAIAESASLSPGSKEASGSVIAYNPTSKALYNATLSLQLPVSVASSANSIVLYGASGSVIVRNNAYLLQWLVPQVAPFSSYPVYYTIINATNTHFLMSPLASFTVPSVAIVSPLRIFDISIPTAYTGQAFQISLSAIYVGSAPENVTFALQAPPSVGVLNPVQVAYALPNSEMRPAFNITPILQSKTYILTLAVYGKNVNQSFSLPLVVLPAAYSAPPAKPGAPGALLGAVQQHIFYVLASIAIAAAVAVVVHLAKAGMLHLPRTREHAPATNPSGRPKPRKGPDKGERDRLISLREHIKRGE